MDQKSDGVFLATLKAKPTKAGGAYYEGKLGNIVIIKAFHKKDGTGLVLRLENAPMAGAQPNPAAHPYSPPVQRVKPRITPRPQQGPPVPAYGATFPVLPPTESDSPPEGLWDEDWGQEE